LHGARLFERRAAPLDVHQAPGERLGLDAAQCLAALPAYIGLRPAAGLIRSCAALPADEGGPMYKRILVPLDGSATAERGLREALGLCAGQPTKLLLLHVVDDYPLLIETASMDSHESMMQSLRQYGLDVLAKGIRACQEVSVPAETSLKEVTGERVSDIIVEEAGRQGCDLIAMGTHGRRGLQRLTLGSQAEAVARASPVPVMLVRLEPPADTR
jgi:nucleotide-binding universal stress UspA family protein